MKDLFQKFQTYMAAAAFAEANEHQTAKQIVAQRTRARQRKQSRLRSEAPRPRPEIRPTKLDD